MSVIGFTCLTLFVLCIVILFFICSFNLRKTVTEKKFLEDKLNSLNEELELKKSFIFEFDDIIYSFCKDYLSTFYEGFYSYSIKEEKNNFYAECFFKIKETAKDDFFYKMYKIYPTGQGDYHCYYLTDDTPGVSLFSEFFQKSSDRFKPSVDVYRYIKDDIARGRRNNLEEVFPKWFDFRTFKEESCTTKTNVKTILKNCKMESKIETEENKDSLSGLISDINSLSTQISDIDITIFVSELEENTNAFIEMYSRMRKKEEKKKLFTDYSNSLSLVKTNLEEFFKCKKDETLDSSKEICLQNAIDSEVEKCSKLAKLK